MKLIKQQFRTYVRQLVEEVVSEVYNSRNPPIQKSIPDPNRSVVLDPGYQESHRAAAWPYREEISQREEEVAADWFHKLSLKQQQEYIRIHPRSRMKSISKKYKPSKS